MEKLYYKVDRTGWPTGPWDAEPDRLEWRDKSTNLPCLIVRNHKGGLCGYVGVSLFHPWYDKPYSDLDVDVHGGLTYGKRCQIDGPICHIALSGESEAVYWLGFDHSHLGDLLPSTLKLQKQYGLSIPFRSDTYRNISYVKKGVTNLAKQIHAAK